MIMCPRMPNCAQSGVSKFKTVLFFAPNNGNLNGHTPMISIRDWRKLMHLCILTHLFPFRSIPNWSKMILLLENLLCDFHEFHVVGRSDHLAFLKSSTDDFS